MYWHSMEFLMHEKMRPDPVMEWCMRGSPLVTLAKFGAISGALGAFVGTGIYLLTSANEPKPCLIPMPTPPATHAVAQGTGVKVTAPSCTP